MMNMKNFKFTIHGNEYEVDIIKVDENIAEIEVNGTPYKIEVDHVLKKQSKTPQIVQATAVPSTDSSPVIAKTSSPSAPKGGGTIQAPLPGVIISVSVKEGDKVAIGQHLITLEAMKMENNIDSDKEGTVVSINVKQGDSVMEGDVLIVIGE